MTTSTGASSSGYGFTGEYQQDSLVYLRARHIIPVGGYAPGMGRFLTHDTWPGEVNRPLSLNRWGYVEGNSINKIDPSGMCWIIENGDSMVYDHWGSGESAFIVLTLCQARYAYSADGPKDINYRTYSCACGDGIKKP